MLLGSAEVPVLGEALGGPGDNGVSVVLGELGAEGEPHNQKGVQCSVAEAM